MSSVVRKENCRQISNIPNPANLVMVQFNLSVHFEIEAGLFEPNVALDIVWNDIADVKTLNSSPFRVVTKPTHTKNRAIPEKLCSPSLIGE